MSILERYILRTATIACLAVLIALTTVIWVTQALRELDLVTGKGQTILIFLRVTALSLPSLVMLIAPFALFLSILYTLNRLNSDSELIVMSAAGVSPFRLFRPFLLLTCVVSFSVAVISLYAMPASFRALRDLVTKVRSDIVTSVVQEGRFITLEKGITFHYREKGAGGTLIGILVQDRRDSKATLTYIAERGVVTDVEGSPYLILEKGSLQRQDPKQADNAVILFDRYAIDMDQFGADGGKISYKPRERSTLALLTLSPDEPDIGPLYGRFRSELHDRFVNPLFPFAILAIGFVTLGAARNTRQGRGRAIALSVLAVTVMRAASFSALTISARSPWGVLLVYAVPLLAIAASAGYALLQFGGARRRQSHAGGLVGAAV